MPCFTGQITNKQIILECWVDDPVGMQDQRLDRKAFTALLDTGAQHTCISQKVVDELALSPAGDAPIQGVGGEIVVSKYMIAVAIPITDDQHTLARRITPLKASLLTADFGADVLLGMDVIPSLHFSIHTGDHFTICI